MKKLYYCPKCKEVYDVNMSHHVYDEGAFEPTPTGFRRIYNYVDCKETKTIPYILQSDLEKQIQYRIDIITKAVQCAGDKQTAFYLEGQKFQANEILKIVRGIK